VLRELELPELPAGSPLTSRNGLRGSAADSPLLVDVENLPANALIRAGAGFQREGMNMLVHGFQSLLPNRLDDAIRVLPALLYVGYRFVHPQDFVGDIEMVNQALSGVSAHARCWEEGKKASISQIACALNENVGNRDAGQLFAEVKSIYDGSEEFPWLPAQLKRNEAVFHAIRGYSSKKAISVANEAADWDEDAGKTASTASTKATAYWMDGEYGTAWDATQQIYREARKLHADGWRENGYAKGGDNLHWFSVIYAGAIARTLARAGYPKDEYHNDVENMEKSLLQFDRPAIGIESVQREILRTKLLTPELDSIVRRMMRPPMPRAGETALKKLYGRLKDL
jgi:hypothetical protein